MKKVLVLALTLFALNVYAEAEKKKVCHEEKGKQVCKVIKVHKKLEGEKIPEKKGKK